MLSFVYIVVKRFMKLICIRVIKSGGSSLCNTFRCWDFMNSWTRIWLVWLLYFTKGNPCTRYSARLDLRPRPLCPLYRRYHSLFTILILSCWRIFSSCKWWFLFPCRLVSSFHKTQSCVCPRLEQLVFLTPVNEPYLKK